MSVDENKVKWNNAIRYIALHYDKDVILPPWGTSFIDWYRPNNIGMTNSSWDTVWGIYAAMFGTNMAQTWRKDSVKLLPKMDWPDFNGS